MRILSTIIRHLSDLVIMAYRVLPRSQCKEGIIFSTHIFGHRPIVWVTVTTGATQPTATDLNLGVVLTQRFQQFLGANRRPMYTDIVLTAIPQLQSSGALNNPFSQTENSTVTYRYATKVGTWDLTQLVAVAFIQSIGGVGEPVYQSAWDVPQINVYANGFNFDPMPLLAGNANSSATFYLINNTSSSQTFKIASGLTTPANYSLKIAGITSLDDSTLTIPAGGTDSVIASVSVSGSALTTPAYIVKFSTLDSIGIGGGSEVAFGQNIPHVVVNCTTETDKAELSGVETSLTNSGFGAIGPITYQAWEELFGLGAANDWSQFKTVWYDDQYNFGIQYLTDTSLITTFLNNGGNFAMSAPDFAYFFSAELSQEGAVGTDEWMNNVFHIENLNLVQGGYSSVEGVVGDPIGSAVTGHIAISAPIYTQTMFPVDDSAHGVYIDPSDDSVAFRVTSNGGKVFYSSFDLGGITTTKRDAMVQAIMDWFYPSSAGVANTSATACSLNPVYPNPITNTATISYTIPDHRYITLVVQDMMGRTIASLVNQEEDAGQYTAPFDASQLANGTYVCTLTAGDFKAYTKMTVNR
jgi:Secretion system C-terminal sorting domain